MFTADITFTEQEIAQNLIPLPQGFREQANGIGTLADPRNSNAELPVEWTALGPVCVRLFDPNYKGFLRSGAKVRITVCPPLDVEAPGGRRLQLSVLSNPGPGAEVPGGGGGRLRRRSAPLPFGPGDSGIPGDALQTLDQVLHHFIASIEGDHQGWCTRLRSYRYAGMNEDVSSLPHLLHFWNSTASPFKEFCQSHDLDWADADVRKRLEVEAESICIWGGVPQGKGYGDAWKVVKSAVQDTVEPGAPMTSGWTKVAAFASDGRENAQTIWDSRVSVSVIEGVDRALDALSLRDEPALRSWLEKIKVVSSESKSRNERISRLEKSGWNVGSCDWRSHFRGSAIVRRLTELLRELQILFPQELAGDFGAQWKLFTVGMALFMDGK
jgi:hypothetical protein